MVHVATGLLILQREKKTSTVHSSRIMYTQFKNVSARTEKTSTVFNAIKMVTPLKDVISRLSTRKFYLISKEGS